MNGSVLWGKHSLVELGVVELYVSSVGVEREVLKPVASPSTPLQWPISSPTVSPCPLTINVNKIVNLSIK